MLKILSKRLLLTYITMGFFISTNVFAQSVNEQSTSNSVQKQLAGIEAKSGGRLGVVAINTADGTTIQYRANERFPFCSTFKVMGISAVLKQSMTEKGLLQQKITYKKEDLIEHSPVTEKHVSTGMTINDLCMAAMTQSDNTAINLLLNKLGGPVAVTGFARSIGDESFRLDRNEPELNTAIPGDLRDTTTPLAMAQSLQKLALSNALGVAQREKLQFWIKHNTTGDTRIRAGVPKGWVVGDKTGTGYYGTTNDIGVIWPPKCKPIVVAIYYTQDKKDADPRDIVIAKATHILISELAKTNKCIAKKTSF